MTKKVLLNAFDMNCVGHINHGLWTHPDDRSADYTSIQYWTELAKLLERGKFDGIFLADVLGTYDVYGGTIDVPLREALQLPVNDPVPAVAAMAAVTRHLGFGITGNVVYEQPYLFARRMSTLDHLTGGRLGWNVVTGYLDSAARAMGFDWQVEHDTRYDLADEYLDLVYALWEGSWAEDAVIRDREARVFTRPDGVRRIRRQGKFLSLDAVHLSEPSPQRTPVIFQAGASDRGQDFAARHAECVFIAQQSKSGARSYVDGLRSRLEKFGRPRDALKAFTGVTIVLGRTDAEARDKFDDYKRHASREAALAHVSSGTGIDLQALGPDDPIRPVDSNAIRSHAANLANPQAALTKRKLLEQMPLGGRFTTLVGSPSTVADELAAWIAEADVDGFNIARTVTPQCYADIVDLLVPELQDRGLYKTGYADGTLREKLFGASPLLPRQHPGAGHRWRLDPLTSP